MHSDRITHIDEGNVLRGTVRWSPAKSLWITAMAITSIVGGYLTFSWSNLLLFTGATAFVLLFGHTLGSHRKLIHDSYQCPKWLEYALVYAGVQVGLAGPLGLRLQHDLRDHAQRQPDCHPYLRHGQPLLADGWWQLHCELALAQPPALTLPDAVAHDRFYRFLERTWMLQQLPPALALYAFGGWPFVVWGVCAGITASVTGHWLIGYFAHNHGPMHNEITGAAVQGHNVRLASLITLGESWHNNHHAFPGSARLGLYPGEWDPGWWTLALLRRCGLVWDIIQAHDLPARPERLALDAAVLNAPEAPVQSLRQTLRDCFAMARRPVALQLSSPCATLPAWALRRLAGDNISILATPGQRRMQLQGGGVTLVGLPALAIAMLQSRRTVAASAALVLLPLALAGEAVRGRFA
ncbi:acyl-CoA desaturase [Duganella sp. FT92W]|uniref:Acyl-CoA desaturase n=1 Tax=Pseudoduganella rivuli TaxID=2666085 RepID=A0A7X2IP46_9BURK|nr:acyl-CoA desaturase [Pseudoduganella rivuli]MRV73348.1 acyl-CoA desaturase [Pseudoduganella rivuli]